MQIIDFLEFNKVICLSQISHHFNDKILSKHRDWTKRSILKQPNLKATWERSLAFSFPEESSSIHLFDRKSLSWKKGEELNIQNAFKYVAKHEHIFFRYCFLEDEQ